MRLADWLALTCHKIATDPRFSGLESFFVDQHGVCLARNLAVETARQRGCTHLAMIDSDQVPDYISGAPPFWDTSINFMLAVDEPCMVAAPTAKADGTVVVYREVETDDTCQLEFVDNEYAATATGIQQVHAVSLAMSLIDLRCFDILEAWRPEGNQVCPPFFRFGYHDRTESSLLFGEESMTMNLTEAGVPVFVNWDCWAGHSKPIIHGKPVAKHGAAWLNDPELSQQHSPLSFRDAMVMDRPDDD